MIKKKNLLIGATGSVAAIKIPKLLVAIKDLFASKPNTVYFFVDLAI